MTVAVAGQTAANTKNPAVISGDANIVRRIISPQMAEHFSLLLLPRCDGGLFVQRVSGTIS
jgi:hypothetical protein